MDASENAQRIEAQLIQVPRNDADRNGTRRCEAPPRPTSGRSTGSLRIGHSDLARLPPRFSSTPLKLQNVGSPIMMNQALPTAQAQPVGVFAATAGLASQ